ncbi:uncharacterized protein TNCV_1196321 [Trichonephila clavipes]|uniref:DUF5641 domain-containing protein n=1 Tax=Trichonephila clavipes TaxID=2585209 RepID=A0A8X6S6M9_TRICX|nr:uncharacterized protein TNCV_1196321 [Trichonephila clavipes]
MYVDDWITGQDTREEALFMSHHAKNIMKEAGMEMRKWISNDTVLMAQCAAEGFDTHPMDASIRSFSSSSIEFKGARNRPQEKGVQSVLLEDSKIVKGSSKRWKQFVANRVQEISKLTDPDSWFHCSGQDNPSDFLSRGLSVDTLISNNKWWNGSAFLRTDELPETVSECPELNEVDYLPELKSNDSKKNIVLTLNFNQTLFDHLLSRSNRFLTIVRVLSFLCRFLFNIRNSTYKKRGPLNSDAMEEAEIYLMKQVQLGSFYTEIRAMQNGDDICNKIRDREESLFAFFAEGIEWSFIPPRSPNWGGLWEANIKSLKYHFKRVAGNSKFSYEELLTLITQIEAILNSRLLAPLSSDVDDLEVLTPAHFLIGRRITAIVEPSLLQCESNHLNVWQRITKSVQTIWKRWSLSYLNSLQQRKKWIVNKISNWEIRF